MAFDRSFQIKIGNGEKTRFWLDVWHDSGLCLKDMYPRLFALKLIKDCEVKDDISSLTSLLHGLSLSRDTLDCWCWTLHGFEKFSVHSLSDTIIHEHLNNSLTLAEDFLGTTGS